MLVEDAEEAGAQRQSGHVKVDEQQDDFEDAHLCLRRQNRVIIRHTLRITEDLEHTRAHVLAKLSFCVRFSFRLTSKR